MKKAGLSLSIVMMLESCGISQNKQYEEAIKSTCDDKPIKIDGTTKVILTDELKDKLIVLSCMSSNQSGLWTAKVKS